jgi:hypothetical protein
MKNKQNFLFNTIEYTVKYNKACNISPRRNKYFQPQNYHVCHIIILIFSKLL